jgi:hypothetical protein
MSKYSAEDQCGSCGHWTSAGRAKLAENSREHPIYNTDFSKPLAELVEEIRNQITDARGKIQDIVAAYPGWNDHLNAAEGMATGLISYLYGVKQEMLDRTVQFENGVRFASRGIGFDRTPGCFCCGGDPGLYSNISGFVTSKEDGEKVITMLEYGARLDYRSYEPDWIQVKIGACEQHLPNLEKLMSLTRLEPVITAKKITIARTLS